MKGAWCLAKQRIAELESIVASKNNLLLSSNSDIDLWYKKYHSVKNQLENPERIKEIVFRFCDYFYHSDGKIWPTHEVGWNAWTQTPKGKKLLNLE